MKDERLKQEMNIIYSEMARLMIVASVISYLVKFLLFHKGLEDCILEYIIMIGSPIYMQIRARAREVSFAAEKMTAKKTAMTIFIVCAAVISVSIAGMALRGGQADLNKWLTFIAVYITLFVVVFIVTQRAEGRRKDRMEKEYDDPDSK
ncbi:DUF6773 family protein [Clostridium sp. AM58-1XD]|uniref:DUF6773 family protein n=1 Tax=Clostridium sp. AM58-1XD TaxID=2292307 RepID=UPI000E54A381|nr:DUF6773 family protein [Clostridium sp. AM58-1XD]RGZ00136.1 hypothetical protein DXA13_05860 [Clostridium sp. AM58-1XD]